MIKYIDESGQVKHLYINELISSDISKDLLLKGAKMEFCNFFLDKVWDFVDKQIDYEKDTINMKISGWFIKKPKDRKETEQLIIALEKLLQELNKQVYGVAK